MISALFGGLGTIIGALIALLGKRKKRKADTIALASQAVADMAGAMEDVIAPLRAEIRTLRLQVALLTRELRKRDIPVPDLPQSS